ncbi:PREDICTED: cholesteryl ester transfer protein [Gekko japonicus]|uniref:Cholesteryl ester transfer protein n=1 Tax=Gekko japonicus TaxID=146911 RepID=A0ABM1KT40_GEKJA|nr:PREDICTED: cholesteryl ester transfer protein [Gekko japonicus]
MMLMALVVLAALGSTSLACAFEPSSFNNTGFVIRITKPAALEPHAKSTGLNPAFHPFLSIHIDDLSIENSEVDFEGDTINIDIQNVSASFKGTLSYGYLGAWWLKLVHLIDFEIESSIDLQINSKLTCEKEYVAVVTSDCYLTFHKLILHLQGDKDPGWLKQLFTNFISFTLKLVLKSQVCKEINFVSQLLAKFFQDTGENFLKDGDIGVDISLAMFPVIKANYIETHHKGLLLYKNYSDSFHDSEFVPSLLSESRMLCCWFSEHVLSSLVFAAFLDDRLMLTITGEELKIFQGASYNDSLAKVWSLSPPQIILQPKGTVMKSSIAVELSVSSRGEETPLVIYFEKDVTVTIQASYVQKRLVLHFSEAVIEPKTMRCSLDIAVNDETLRHFLEKTITVAGIPEVISRIEPALTSLMNSKGLDLVDIVDPEIITRNGYLILQMDFDFPHHLLHGFLKRNLF